MTTGFVSIYYHRMAIQKTVIDYASVDQVFIMLLIISAKVKGAIIDDESEI
jgi:hypothetical protein